MEQKENNIEIRFFVHLYGPERHHKTYVIEALNDFITLDNNASYCDSNNRSNPIGISIQWSNNPDKPGHIGILAFKCLFSYSMRFDKERFANIEEYSTYTEMCVVSSFITKIKSIVILSHIGYPSALELRSGTCFVNEQKVESDEMAPMITSNRVFIDYIHEIGWPKLKKLPIIVVYKWFEVNDFAFDEFSNSKTGRALMAYSHIFSSKAGFDFDLFWALFGIEALYCRGKDGITNQIYEKTQVVLGPMKEYKSRLKEMYDFRSRFVHGDINIPGVFYENIFPDVKQEVEFEEKHFQATALAIVILIRSLQEIILQNIPEFRFKYVQE